MREFIEKLIGRLEEKENETVLKAPNTSDISNAEYQKWMMKSYGFKESIEIVNELAEEYKPKTQADKIRLMSDEELADYIIFIGANIEEKIPYCKSTPQCTEILDSGRIVPDKMCRECLVKWLKSEAE